MTSVCTGSLIHGAAGLLRGYQATSHWGVLERIADYGATPSEARICIDRNRATGGGVTSGIDFALHMAGLWKGEAFGRMVELILEYNPAPPFGAGHPSLADAGTIAQASTLLAGQFS
ncbi:MAG: DJ-1/PfpI family protein [Rhizobiales bacterium]|nr:DJ-1/PfpI family protein [Hyphomicrobiales bacterium]